MQNILTLPLCQGSYSESKNHDKISSSVNHGKIELISHELLETAMPSENVSVALEQVIEEAEHNAYLHAQELHSYFSLTRGVEV